MLKRIYNLRSFNSAVATTDLFIDTQTVISIPPLLKSWLYSYTSYNFLFTEHLYHCTHDSQVENFIHIFHRNYNTRISGFWFQGLYKSTTPCDSFSDSSLWNFLLTENIWAGESSLSRSSHFHLLYLS